MNFFRGLIFKMLGINTVPAGFYPLNGQSLDVSDNSVWFFTGVKAIAQTATQAPLKIFRKDKEAIDIENYFLKPNEFSTGREMWETLMSWLEYKGIAFILKQANKLYVLDSDLVKVRKDETGYLGFDWHYGKSGEFVTYSPDEVSVFYNYSPKARLEGFSSLDILKKTINLSGYSDEVSLNFFKHGGMMQGYFSTDAAISESQARDLRKIWESRYAGSSNSWKMPFLSKGLKFYKTALTPADYQFLSLEAVTKNRISSVLGVPSVLLNDTDNLNYATAKEQIRVFWENTLIPKLLRLEDRINAFLLPKFGHNLKAEFDLSQVKALREDLLQKIEAAVKMYSMGVPINVINQRLNLGLPELPWGWDWYGPLNITQIGTGYTPPQKKLNNLLRKMMNSVEEKKKIEKSKITDLIWKEAVAKATSEESKFAKVLMKFWKKQENDVLNYLEGKKGFKLPKSWDEALAKTMKPYLLAFMQQSGDAEANKLGISFDVQAPEIQTWLNRKVMNSALEINDVTRKDILKELAEAQANGEGIREMEGRIKNLFEQTYKHRAATVARTEVFSANNRANMVAAMQAGMRTKTWIAALDERTRAWHAAADGQTVGIHETFNVDAEPLLQPGDPTGSGDNIINCRCVMTYNTKEPKVNANTMELDKDWTGKSVVNYLKTKRGWNIGNKEQKKRLANKVEDVVATFKNEDTKFLRRMYLTMPSKFDFINETENDMGFLSRLIRELPRPNEPIFRGIALPKEQMKELLKKGASLNIIGPTSFSTDFDLANTFAQTRRGIDYETAVFVVKKPPANSFYIDALKVSKYSNEHEVLVNNVKYVVKEVKEGINVDYQIVLEEVKP